MTASQVAEILRVHPGTLKNWRMRGVGPAYLRMGERAIRYRRSVISEWLESGSAVSA